MALVKLDAQVASVLSLSLFPLFLSFFPSFFPSFPPSFLLSFPPSFLIEYRFFLKVSRIPYTASYDQHKCERKKVEKLPTTQFSSVV